MRPKGFLHRAAVILAAAVSIGGTIPAVAFAQQDDKTAAIAAAQKKRVDVNVENADIRYVLKLLFNAVGVNYTIDPVVQGTVTVSLTDVPFRTALESVMKSVESASSITYRVEDNVYHVGPRKEEPANVEKPIEPEPPAEPRAKIAKIHLNFIDAADLAQVVGGRVIQTRFGVNALLYGWGSGQGSANQGGFGQGGFGQGGFGQGGFGQSGFGQGGFGQGGFGQGGFGQFGNGGFFNGGNTGRGSGNGSIGGGNNGFRGGNNSGSNGGAPRGGSGRR